MLAGNDREGWKSLSQTPVNALNKMATQEWLHCITSLMGDGTVFVS